MMRLIVMIIYAWLYDYNLMTNCHLKSLSAIQWMSKRISAYKYRGGLYLLVVIPDRNTPKVFFRY